MVVKTDMSKAYDRIEWEFLEKVLQQFGFEAVWINWVMECVTTVSYSYLINGAPYGSVSPKRGLRQGDPLSPFLFILCTEVLISHIQQAELSKSITGINNMPTSGATSPTATGVSVPELLRSITMSSATSSAFAEARTQR